MADPQDKVVNDIVSRYIFRLERGRAKSDQVIRECVRESYNAGLSSRNDHPVVIPFRVRAFILVGVAIVVIIFFGWLFLETYKHG
jgi:hypothetical protein